MANNKNILKIITILLTILVINENLQAQQKSEIGIYRNSYKLSWAKQSNVIGYEYIVTDNPLCFAGCIGDTKQAITEDTSIIIFPNNENIPYFWKIRPVYSENDTLKEWLRINTFSTTYPKEISTNASITIYPNPAVHEKLFLKIDWSLLENTQLLPLTIYTLLGVPIYANNTLVSRNNTLTKFTEYEIDIRTLPPQNYIIEFIDVQKNKIQVRFQKL